MGPAQSNRETPLSFEFSKAIYLVEATTRKAASLSQLLTGVTPATDMAIFYHLHHHFFINPAALAEYPNEFARWVGDVLGNGVVIEQLANLNLFRAANLTAVRREIAVILAQYLTHSADTQQAPLGRAFIFCQPRQVILPCGSRATTPPQFLAALRTAVLTRMRCQSYRLDACTSTRTQAPTAEGAGR